MLFKFIIYLYTFIDVIDMKVLIMLFIYHTYSIYTVA